MVTTLHPVTIKLDEDSYLAAKTIAESRGYFSIEEYLGDLLARERVTPIPMTAQLKEVLNEGIADVRAGNTISLDEHLKQHADRRAEWIRAQQK